MSQESDDEQSRSSSIKTKQCIIMTSSGKLLVNFSIGQPLTFSTSALVSFVASWLQYSSNKPCFTGKITFGQLALVIAQRHEIDSPSIAVVLILDSASSDTNVAQLLSAQIALDFTSVLSQKVLQEIAQDFKTTTTKSANAYTLSKALETKTTQESTVPQCLEFQRQVLSPLLLHSSFNTSTNQTLINTENNKILLGPAITDPVIWHKLTTKIIPNTRLSNNAIIKLSDNYYCTVRLLNLSGICAITFTSEETTIIDKEKLDLKTLGII